MFEIQVIELLQEIVRKQNKIDQTLASIDTGVTDVVHVIELNTEAITAAIDEIGDRIAAVVRPSNE